MLVWSLTDEHFQIDQFLRGGGGGLLLSSSGPNSICPADSSLLDVEIFSNDSDGDSYDEAISDIVSWELRVANSNTGLLIKKNQKSTGRASGEDDSVGGSCLPGGQRYELSFFLAAYSSNEDMKSTSTSTNVAVQKDTQLSVGDLELGSCTLGIKIFIDKKEIWETTLHVCEVDALVFFKIGTNDERTAIESFHALPRKPNGKDLGASPEDPLRFLQVRITLV